MLSREELTASLLNDPMNIKRIRNRRNTPKEAYNCCGFALGIYDWICPYVRTDDTFDLGDDADETYTDEEREFLMEDFFEAGMTEGDVEEEILRRDVDFLLRNYPFLCPVNLEDCDDKDTVIAYRLFIRYDDEYGTIEDTDFHFKIRIGDFWFEKLGSDPVRPCALDADKPWEIPGTDTRYTSRIEYFTIDKDYFSKKQQ